MSNTIDCPKCKHEHTPSGSHADDSGEWECEECGFKFRVEVEYNPEYSTFCLECEYGEFKDITLRARTTVVAKFCKYCMACKLKEQA